MDASDYTRVPAADVLDRLPDDRQRQRRRGHRAGGLPPGATTATRRQRQIESPKAYLATITTRLAIDHLRSARVRRESYVGTWLPEPLLGGPTPTRAPGPAELAETSDSLSMAFLVLLESLSPPERAVFLLREVFGYGYQRDRRAHRQDRGRLPADLRPRPPPHRRGPAEVRDVPRRGRGADQPVPGRGRRRRHEQPLERLAPDVLFYGDSGGRARRRSSRRWSAATGWPR